MVNTSIQREITCTDSGAYGSGHAPSAIESDPPQKTVSDQGSNMDDAKTSEQHSAGGPGSVAMSVNDSDIDHVVTNFTCSSHEALDEDSLMVVHADLQKDRTENNSIYPAPIDQEYFLLDLPTDRPRSLQRSTAGSLWPIHIEKQRMLALLAIARENSVDLNVVLLSAWIAVLSRLSGQSELAVAVQGFSKNLEIKGADAYMYSSICADLSGDPSAERLFDLIKGAVLGLSAPRRLRQNDLCTLHQASFTWYDKRHCSSADDMGHSSSSAIHVGFDVELHLQVVDEQIVGAMQFATALFDPFTIERHVGYLQSMLDGVVSNADQRVSKISVLSPVERMLLLDTWNSTPATNQEFPTLHKLFEEQVKRTPKAIALVYEDQAMTYAELNERSNGVAHQLIELGVRPDTCVAICAGRSIGMVVGVLAILKSGGAYVPLDPAHVSERLLDILAEVSPLVVLADSVGRDIIQEADLPSIKIIDPNVPYKGSTANPCVPSLSTRHLAYVIYTSGSTGKPKGVMIEHRQVTRLFSATEDWFDFKEFDTWCLFHSFAFDVSVWEMWGALQSGGKLVIIPQDIARSPQDLYRLVCELGVTVLNLTPSAFKPIIECHTRDGIRDSLRYVILAGEALATAMLQPWYLTHTRDSPQVVNMYGPTETAIYATYRLISPEDCLQHSSPIGVRLPDVRTYVLDEHAQPVPLGAVGELYVGGAGVARGYLNRPQLTAERFLLDPFVDQPEGHMYRTGDLVKYLEDGSLVYLGRNDHQVKIRGFRIELGEIEARLAEHPAVSEAAVVALDDQAEKQLVAYVVTRAEDQSKKILEECQSSSADQLALTLRSHLMKRLPEYMVPAFFVHMDMLPLNPNGKLDRNALLAPGELHYARQMYEAPRGRIERTLAALWSNLLHVEHVSRHDNFFALGGHSLLATKVLEHLRRTGLTVSVRALFECPTLHALARAVEDYKYVIIPSNLIAQHSKSLTPEMLPLVDLNQADIDSIIDKIPGGLSNIQDIYSLSPLQEGILFHHLLATNGDPYLLTSTVAFESRALLDRYLTAFQTVVNRHDILRTSFFWENISTSAQVVCRKADLPIEELRLDADNGDIAHQLDKRFNPRHYRIDLCQAPLLRFIIAKNTDNRWLLVQLVHHLIGDHDSLDKMQNEIKSLLDGHDEQLPQPRSFRDHLAQIRLRTSPEADEMFFRGMLADLGEPTLPFGLTKVEDGGTDIMESHQILSQDLNDRLRLQAKQLRVSLATLCHVAWAQVLARTSGQRQVVFGTLLFGRLQAGDGSGHALGLSMSTLPFRCDVDERTVLKCVMDTQLHLTALLEHEHASLVLAQRCSKLPAGTPLFSGLLNYRHSSPPSINISGASEVEFVSQDGWFEYPGIQVLSSQQRTNYPFTLAVDDFGVALSLTAQVVHPFDPSRICGYMRKALEGLVEALESAGDIPIHTLDVLPDNERELLLKTWNGNPMDYPHQLCLQTLFEHQVERTPDAIALVYEDQSLSYDELNIRANRLAHRLVQLGVKPDTLVAICVERSPAMIIGILAILKAGGAYVPLDPFYASERLRDILLDAAPNIIVADSAGRNVLGDASLSNIMVVEPDVRDHSVSSSNPHIERLTSRHLAYVIYTSGSTGKPKGVLVEHVGVVNFVQCMQEVLQVGSSSHCTQFLSVSFDASANEIFNAVCYGGCLHLLQDSVRLDRERMWDYLQRHTVTHAILTPTLLQQCQDMPALRSLRTVTVTGEAMPPSLPQVLRKIAPNSTIINGYGPTECCIGTTLWQCTPDYCGDIAPIGRPISYKTIYLIDGHGKPVPLGAVGEIFIGGVGVARGYLNRPELTADRFLPDPFTFRSEAQMYKTGDLARYLPDGNLLYMGRNDDQIKIRGFRVELGEIEARLSEHNTVSEAVVIALGEGSYKRLVAYVIVKQGTQLERFKDAAEGSDKAHLATTLRSYLATRLPGYMIPAAFVRMNAFPLTPNGKLDRRGLPIPGDGDFSRQEYEAPQGDVELALAGIWADLLRVERVSRHDSFFALGGHSLLAVQLIARLHRLGHSASVRAIFEFPTLSVLAQSFGHHISVVVPPNLINHNTTGITPEMLPLINLDQNDIDRIIEQIPGGVTNIQDIYALSPLQDGILFHHLMAKNGDPYVLHTVVSFDNERSLDRYLDVVQQIVNRHDILRTAFMWQHLSAPTQVVWRDAPLSITQLDLDPAAGPIIQQLKQMFDHRSYRMDLTQAPLLHFAVAQESDGRWIVIELLHHLIGDHSTLEIMQSEIQSFYEGKGDTLAPAQPYRNLIAQARLGLSQEEHERFFKEMLADIDTPSLPFGMTNVHGDGIQVTETGRMLSQDLNDRLRLQARKLGVSVTSLFHVAWAQVIARTSGEQRVVFGTVLFGRMQDAISSDGAMGLFINTLPIRIDLDRDSVEQSVRVTHGRLAGLLEHEHASLALAQRCSSVATGVPLFSALLNYRHNLSASKDNAYAYGMEYLESEERTDYPFTMSVEDNGTSLCLTAQVVQPHDPDRICGYMQEALNNLTRTLELAPSTPIMQLEVVPLEERQLLLRDWNATEKECLDHLCLHQLFEQQVERTPDAIALVYEDQSLSYDELNSRANSLAHKLARLGVKPDTLVAICVERSPAMIIGILAILKAGGAYVPLDPFYASERLRDILLDAAPNIMVADSAGRHVLGDASLSNIMVVEPDVRDHSVSSSNPHIERLTSRHLAYVIYTSGSTGKPKGVLVEHVGVVNFVRCLQKVLQVGSFSHCTQLSSVSFDASALEILSTICFGGCLHLLQNMVRLDQEQIWSYLQQHSVTVTFLTPTLLQHCQDMPALKALRRVIVGGEAMPSSLLQVVRRIAPNSTVINAYGPTECSIGTTLWSCSPDFWGDIAPIGRPISHSSVYLLDCHGNPVPMGAVGEMFIGGIGIARGYLNRLDLTTERFLPDPFAEGCEARMYKTGDLARYLPDGNLVYMGRNDNQIKIRGFRVELEEIEARLTEHSLISEAVVIAACEESFRRLVAYVTVRMEYQMENKDETERADTVHLSTTLRSYLATRLPDYMVPAAFVRLDAFPLTPNGKLDRRALPVPGDSDFAHQQYETPQGQMENVLAAIWAELLRVERVSRHDSFFALGGHSLLAVRLVNRTTRLGANISLSSLFSSPTLAAFASLVGENISHGISVLPVITPVSRESVLPLSFAQQRLWFLVQLEDVNEAYNVPTSIRLRGHLNLPAWKQAWDVLYARHEALRSIFVSTNGSPEVHILPPEGMSLRSIDLQDAADRDTELKRLTDEETGKPFDLAQGPLVRATMIQTDDDEYIMLITQHHIVSDGWSSGIMLREISQLYTCYCKGEPSPLAPLVIQYPDYAAWQRQWLSGDRLQAQSDYWRTTLSGAPILIDLPTDRPRPPQQSFQGDHVPITLDAQLTRALKQLSQRHGVTLFMTIISAWSVVLARLSGQDDIVIGTPSANRSRQEIESLIGFFVNTLAMRIDMSGDPNTRELLERVRNRTLAAHAHQDLPFEQVVEVVQPLRKMSHTPLFQVMFAWQNNEEGEWDLPGLQASPYELDHHIAKFDLTLALWESDHGIVGGLEYATSLFNRSTIERHIGYLHKVLQTMASDLDHSLAAVDILSPEERTVLVDTWNVPHMDYPDELCLHHLFEQQVERTPETIAVVHEDQFLTYGELNMRANSLARQLIKTGVQPGSLVAICVERSVGMIIGILAILKAGGAYVPLDPVHASERLLDILSDASPYLLLADQTGLGILQEVNLSKLKVIDPNVSSVDSTANPHVPSLSTHHLAYVIYTSGSTGKPKGVMVEHCQVTRLFHATAPLFDFSKKDIWCLFHSFAFDVSVWEIWGALLNGGKLVVVPLDIARSPKEMYQLVCDQSITVLNTTPSAFKMFAESDIAGGLHEILRYVILAGEALAPALLRTWYATHAEDSPRIINMYGPTESAIYATYRLITPEDCDQPVSPIGMRIPDLRIYVLDGYRRPVPLGTVGELYVGGAGVARGYLNQPQLTAEKFLQDPFVGQLEARMYKTGDLVRYLHDGSLVYLGRNDHQVKIRGFRIELGEIEMRLSEHPTVSEAVVVALGEDGNQRLVAYIVARHDIQFETPVGSTLRSYLATKLPEYMVPAAFVRVDVFPLTPNGKLDRRALPVPGNGDFAQREYEAPRGEIENVLAGIWTELLHVEEVSRHDSFFALGGHSLLAVQLIARLHRLGYSISARAIFEFPTLSVLAQSLGHHISVVVPPNLINHNTTGITPEMLPLINLDQNDIDRIIEQIPGGVTNIQDIYALSPLQDGILFHHLMAKNGDPYVLHTVVSFDNERSLDRYLDVVQQIVNRHDILRTAFMWQHLSAPTQVVWRDAPLSITQLDLDPAAGPIIQQLKQMFDHRSYRMDLTQAPLLHFAVAQESDGRWIVIELLHHLIGDHSTLEIMQSEIQSFYEGKGDTLAPAQPYRNLIAQARLGLSQEEHERFFKEMLADIDTPSLPFGMTNVHGDGIQVTETGRMLSQDLNDRLRLQARKLGVSVTSLFHVAWAQVIARTSGEQRVVFGTVLFGRMQDAISSDGAMGLFINTLPIRIDLDRDSVEQSVRVTHGRLAGLLEHEHASLALAQRCSSVATGVPLFSALLNYRHNLSASKDNAYAYGMEYLESEERTNYPLSMSVEDYGASLGLTAKVVQPHDPDRICGYMQEALNNLARTLELAPSTPIWQLEVIPPEERQLLLRDWNAAQQNYPDHLCLHQLFEQQVERTPEAIAIVHGDQSLTYAELNYRANCLAHHLVALGVKPDSLVAICVERSIAMIFAVLAVLKAGGAYVPLDPFYASGRLRDIIADAAPSILLADRVGRDVLGDATLVYLTVVDPSMPRLESASNLQIVGLTSCHLAYVIYTSGSTGAPKGVMLEHQGAVNLVYDRPALFDIQPESRVLQYTSLGFDHSVSEIFSALRCGASLHLLNDDIRLDRYQLWDYMKQRSITHVSFTPTLLQDCKEMPALHALKTLVVMGEAMPQSLPNFLRDVAPNGIIVNSYGPTECSVSSTVWKIPFDFSGDHVPIGRPLPNKTIYLLDIHGNPVPLGAIGEMYIGGVGVARGYLNRPDLTAEKFVADPFTVESGTRMYKTGDLARHFPDGTLMHVGRSDHQVKIRGFRIELGEIEARLTEHPSVSEAVVIALDDGSNKRLVAYVIERHQALLESAANTAEATMTSQLAFALRSYLATKLPEYMVPAAFVRMDTLPLTHNGKLDRKALPSPEGSAFAFQAYEEPRGEVENMLSSIWRELLKVERVGRNDGFFNLGGHSLMAVRMIGRIRAMLGFNLSLRTLFEAPTIAELAPRLLATGAAQDESYDVLLPIKPRGSRPPLFCIHPGIGLSWCFTGLSTQMDPEQPLYGLQARGFVGDGKMAETLEEMVVDYIDQIRSIQPHGPYHLLGYSFGGLVAHTMASYLEEQGERVALVALMDTRPDLGRRAQHASRGDEDDTVAKADLQEIFLGNMDRYSTEIINSFMDKILMVHRNILRINAQTHRVIKGNLLIFRATVLSDDVKELLSPDDWKPYVLGETWVCDIECEHARMDSPESTASIGRVLNQMLKELHRQAQRED